MAHQRAGASYLTHDVALDTKTRITGPSRAIQCLTILRHLIYSCLRWVGQGCLTGSHSFLSLEFIVKELNGKMCS